MDIKKYIKHDNGSLNYDLIEDLFNALHLRAKEDLTDKLLPEWTLLNLLVEAEPAEVQHFEVTGEPPSKDPAVTQPKEQQLPPQQPPVQECEPEYAALNSQPAAPISPPFNAVQQQSAHKPQTPRIRCSCGCGQLCSLYDILEHQLQAMADDEREITIISRALESLRVTMNLPLCHFSKQLRKAVRRYECQDCRDELAMCEKSQQF